MTSSAAACDARVLFLAPTRRDAETTSALLRGAGISLTSCTTFDGLLNDLNEGAGAVIVPEEMITPGWLRGTVILHGCLNPVQCILFGVLLCHHIRVGWQMRANLLAGFLLEGVFAGLILTGVAMYYAPETWHDRVVWGHRAFGVALPVTLGLHWLTAHFWIRRVTPPPA